MGVPIKCKGGGAAHGCGGGGGARLHRLNVHTRNVMQPADPAHTPSRALPVPSLHGAQALQEIGVLNGIKAKHVGACQPSPRACSHWGQAGGSVPCIVYDVGWTGWGRGQ